jgi:purine-binding chemotaxis protein CheW
VTQDAATFEPKLQYLSFEVSAQRCGVLLCDVQEVVEYHAITRVPAAPRFVLGVFNLRGNVVPVVDLASYLGLAPRPVGKRSCLIVLREQERQQSSPLALLADSVDNVLELSPSELQAAPSVGTRIAPELLSGVATRDERLFQLLAIERLLALDSDAASKLEAEAHAAGVGA